MGIRALIFDFDDTLVECYSRFLHYETLFLERMQALGFSALEEIRDFSRERDIALVTAAGYPAPECFPRALQETYRHFSLLAGRQPDGETEKQLFRQAWQVHQDVPQTLPAAEGILQHFYGRIPLFLFSQGEQASQLRRIRNSGLAPYFQAVVVCRLKTPERFRQLLAEQDIDPASSWLVGNSLKSDIHPAQAAGLNAVYFDTTDWNFDQEESPGGYHHIHDLNELRGIILP